MIELGKIYCEDCIETMRRMPDKSVDLIVTDPPYPVNVEGGAGIAANWRARTEYFEFIRDYSAISSEFARVLREDSHAYVFCSSQFMPEMIRQMSALRFVGVLTLIKNNSVVCGGYGMRKTEQCLLFTLGFRRVNDESQDDVLYGEKVKNEGHPTVKPLNAISELVSQSSNVGGIVYDPFMGSGTTAVACERLGRKWIGSEINPDYVKIAEKRIANERAQLKMDFK